MINPYMFIYLMIHQTTVQIQIYNPGASWAIRKTTMYHGKATMTKKTGVKQQLHKNMS